MLVTILLTLLAFTALTVFLSRFEIWFGEVFQVEVANWINIVIVLSIATIKSILVGLYFMQLKYDHPINSVVFLFCLFAFGLFLSFTMIDLGTRGHLYAYKGVERKLGGMGIDVGARAAGVAPAVNTGGDPIAVFWRKAELERLAGIYGEEEGHRRYWEKYRIAHGYPAEIPAVRRIPSDPNRSRPRTGLTPGIFDPVAPEAPPRDRGLRGARDIADPNPSGSH